MIEVIGASHKTAPLELRERLAREAAGGPGGLRRLRDARHLEELAVISTCNRVEFYVRTRPEANHFGHHVAAVACLSREAVSSALYHSAGADAARHLFAVASGLDAMVVGETEILGQCKAAYQAARAAGTAGTMLNALFQRAFTAAKRVHSETGISRGKVSLGSVAASLMRREIGCLPGRRVLVVGAGAMAESVLAGVACEGVAVTVANRTGERGERLAARFNARAADLADLAALLPEADIVITSTSGDSYLVTPGMALAAAGRRREPLVVLDVSVPRNVDPACASVAGVRLFNIDDLKGAAEANLAVRREKLDKAFGIVDEEVKGFEVWLAEREVVPVVRRLRERAKRTADAELEAALRNVAKGAAAGDEMRKLARRLTNKFLHEPLSALKAAADSEDAERLADAARRLHGIRDNGEKQP